MPRHVNERNLSTRESRKGLKVSPKPYFRSLDEGLHIGYRKSRNGGAWVVRFYLGHGAYRVQNLEGRPDDVLEADGATVLSWNQAQAAARDLFQRTQRLAAGLSEVHAGSYTVRHAIDEYLVDYEARGGKSLLKVKLSIARFVIPELGNKFVSKLKRAEIAAWHRKLAEASALTRGKKGEKGSARTARVDDPEAKRRRRSTANRLLTNLKAALNLAFDNQRVSDKSAWDGVKPFQRVDAARVRYLTDDESRRLVRAAQLDFRPMIQAALLTGCRYGELAALTVGDYNAKVGTLLIGDSKSGRPRHVYLTDEGRTFFNSAIKGKLPGAAILSKQNGTSWGTSHQTRPFLEAAKAAKLGSVTFHELRHTYASRLIMRGVPLPVIAAQLGHADTRMVSKHYGHLAPSYIADTLRAAFGKLGILKNSARKRSKQKLKSPDSRRNIGRGRASQTST